MTEKKNNQLKTLPVDGAAEGSRLDVFCTAQIDSLSRNQVQGLNESGAIDVDGVRRPDHYQLSAGETVTVVIPVESAELPEPQDIDLQVVFEDEHIIVVNKAAGMVVHPAHGNRDQTLVNALLGRGVTLSPLGGSERPGIVHRLDKDTSGLMMVAKTDTAYRSLQTQLKAREVDKVYHAIVWGNTGVKEQTIDAPIARHPAQRQKMTIAKSGGREAVTRMFVVDTFGYFDYIRVVTLTGRTHQIRVHLAHISHPILGDSVYGGRRRRGIPSTVQTRVRIEALLKVMRRQALHASRLAFDHPASGQRMSFVTGLPADMQSALECLHGENWTREVRR